jgi:peptide/nickel transport system permease protein
MAAQLIGVAIDRNPQFAGHAAGYVGGWTDQAIMRVMDVFFSFPPILLALGIVAALGPVRN